MLSLEENQLLTQVGPGTPAGHLLRRYWQAIAPAVELTEMKPKKRVRILGEDLLLYRDRSGGYGLVGEHCSHRGASLYYGFIEDDGIRCPYHGWKYDACGKCLEQPFENPATGYKDKIQHPAYPVEKQAGLLFAYMGPPDKKPLLPKWDLLVRQDGLKKIDVCEALRCNWLQAMENSVDPTHTYYLHSHPLIFPNILFVPVRTGYAMHFRTPIDDLNTAVFQYRFSPTEDGRVPEQPEDPPIEYISTKNRDGEFHLDHFASQDHMAWESQGAVASRDREHLGESDRGIIMFRQLLTEQIKAVQNGADPIGTNRDPRHDEVIQLIQQGYSAFSFAAARREE
jgi:5,5'-dehydrodivanillate O-demethylase oxygenase subunit